MNEIMKSLKARKSVRQFLDKRIPDEIRAELFQAALEAPTAGNMTLYSVIEVTDQKIKDILVETCDNQPFIASAPMVLVFLADYNRWFECFRKHVDSVREVSYGDFLLAQADAIIAAQNVVAAAEGFGIGSCYIGDITENYERHKELFELPPHVAPAAMLCLGYPTENQKSRNKPARFKAEDIFFENTYNNKKAEEMDRMLCEKQGFADESELDSWIKKFCNRKWNSEFSEEMSRSVRVMIEDFCAKDSN